MCCSEHIGDFLFILITVVIKKTIKFLELSLLQILGGICIDVHCGISKAFCWQKYQLNMQRDKDLFAALHKFSFDGMSDFL